MIESKSKMGNCQAIDNAVVIVQHPDGRNHKMYNQITANEIMKMHPGHYVALLLTTTTTLHHPSTTINRRHHGTSPPNDNKKNNININPAAAAVRVTRIKLLKPTDTLLVGHVYRLLTYQEVKKGLWARKCAKKLQQPESSSVEKLESLTIKEVAELEEAIKRYEPDNTNQLAKDGEGGLRSRFNFVGDSSGSKSRNWLPSLQSISEAAGN